MSGKLPPFYSNDRRRFSVTFVALALGQAATMGVATVATRHIVAAMHGEQASMPIMAHASLLAAGAAAGAIAVILRSARSVVAERRNGALTIRLISDLAAMRNWVSLGIPRIISGAVIVPAAILALYLLNPILVLVALDPLAVVIVGLVIAGTLLPQAHSQLRSERDNLSIDMMERVSHAPQIRLFDRVRSVFKLLCRCGASLMSAASGFVQLSTLELRKM